MFYLVLFLVPVGATAHCFLYLVLCAVWVFPCFLYVLPLVFGFVLSLGQSCSRLVLVAWGGVATGRRSFRVGLAFRVHDVAEDLVYFVFFPLLQLVSQVSVDTPSLNSHHWLADYYCSKVAPWQEM